MKPNLKSSLVISLLIELVKVTHGIHDYFCMDVGKNDTNGVNAPNVLFPNNNFEHAFTYPDNSLWEFNQQEGFEQPFPPYFHNESSNWLLTITGIKLHGQGHGELLRGYFHLRLDIPDNQDYRAFIIQAQAIHASKTDPHEIFYGGFGEFLHDFPTDACQLQNYVQPNRYQFAPCRGLHHHDILPGNSFVYNTEASKEYMNPNPDPNNTPKIFHLFWRHGDQWCNHVQQYVFRISIVPKVPDDSLEASGFYIRPTYLKWITTKFRGAYDPMPTAAEIFSCETQLKQGNVIPIGHGLEEYNESLSFDPSRRGACSSKKAVRPPIYGFPFEVEKGRYGDATARCADTNQRCFQATDLQNAGYVEYSDYVNTIIETKKSLCLCPETEIETETESESERDRKLGIDADKFPGSVIWSYRVYHGIIGIIGTLFITPVSIFISRYYKETFMRIDVMFNRLWYMVHLFAALFNLTLHFLGWVPIHQGINILGHSKTNSANFHRVFGWGAISLCGFMTILGGFRPLAVGPRKLVICLHWLFGIFYYVLCLAACIVSVYIYGSPSATSDASIKKSRWQYVMMLIVFWIVADLIFHAVMTVHECRIEANLELDREYLPAPIPIIDENEQDDTPGYVFRERVLVVYVGLSLFITVITCIWIFKMPSGHRGFGFMTCTHDADNEYLLSIPDECRA